MPRWSLALLAFCFAIAGVLVCTSQPLKTALHSQGALHPWFHLVPFGVLAFLIVVSFRRLPLAILLTLFLLLPAWGTEFREHLADGWPVEQADVLLDVVGIAVGALAGLLSRRFVRSRP